MLTWARLTQAAQAHVIMCADCQLYAWHGYAEGEVSLCPAGIGIQYSHTARV